jgi:hypothetical protein
MAILDKDDAAWWRYAIEFARRGLWPMGEIETHGPHPPAADKLWGEAFCATEHRGTYMDIEFSGPTGCRHYSDIRGLRMREKDGLSLPVLGTKESSTRARHWLKYAIKRYRQLSA